MLCFTEVHSYLIIYAFSRIGGKADVLSVIKGFCGTDKPDYAYRDKIVRFLAVGVVLFYDICHKAKVVVYQLVTGGKVALSRFSRHSRSSFAESCLGNEPLLLKCRAKKIRLCSAVCSTDINIISHSGKIMIQFIPDILPVMQVHSA